MKAQTSGKWRKLRSSSLLALLAVVAVIFGMGALTLPGVAGQEPGPSPSPTPTLGPSGESPAPLDGTTPSAQAGWEPGTAVEESSQAYEQVRVLETLTIPANGDVIQSETVLTEGMDYAIRVTGMYIWGGCDPLTCPGGGPEYLRWGDANNLTDDHWHGFSDPYWLGFIYLKVNNMRWYFGPYSPSHLYSRWFKGTGDPVTFRIEDCSYCYPDNGGSLRVEILEGIDGAAFDLGIVPFPQCGYPTTWLSQWGSDSYGDPETADPDVDTICRWGAKLSSWAMILDYWAFDNHVHTNPRLLNQTLRHSEGYSHLLVDPRLVRSFGQGDADKFLVYSGKRPYDPEKLHDLLLEGIPVILTVDKNGPHFVVATGETVSEGMRTWYLNDPGGLNTNQFTDLLTTLRDGYGDQASWMEWFWDAGEQADVSAVTLALDGSADLLVTDLQGRRTGFDPRRGIAFGEIPDAFYGLEQIADGQGGVSLPLRLFDLPTPLGGSYIVQVIAAEGAPYTLKIIKSDQLGILTRTSLPGEIEAGSVDAYRMDYSPVPGVEIETTEVDVAPLDIKPGSCPNALNLKAHGVLAVAILGTENFDATSISPDSVHLEGVAPLRWAWEDAATPFEPLTGRLRKDDCTDARQDGWLDLTLKYDLQEISAALGEVTEGQVRVLRLEGNLGEEYGSSPFVGEDVVVILK